MAEESSDQGKKSGGPDAKHAYDPKQFSIAMLKEDMGVKHLTPDEIKSLSDEGLEISTSSAWKKRFQQHFPHAFKMLEKRDSKCSEEKQEQKHDPVNWEAEFGNFYIAAYKKMNKKVQYLFIRAKAGTLVREFEAIISQGEKPKKIPVYNTDPFSFELSDLDIADENDYTIVSWASKNHQQIALNHFYQFVLGSWGGPTGTVTWKDRYSRTALHWAAACGQPKDIIEDLITQGIDVDIVGTNNLTPLHLATRNGHLETARALLEKGANVNASGKNGATPLHLAAKEGHLEIMEMLLESSADINAICHDGTTSLHIAAQEGHLESVRTLLEKKADFTEARNDGSTPILIAATKGHLEVILALLEKKAPLNTTEKYGLTPLQIALREGHLKAAKALLENSASANAVHNDHTTPIGIAAEKGFLEMVETLLKKGANVAALPGYSSPLCLAVREGHFEVVLALLAAKNIKVDAESFSAAVEKNRLDIAQALLAKGADVNAISLVYRRQPPLCIAARKGDLRMISALLDAKDINVNTDKIYGPPPLQIAVKNGHLQVVEALLAKKADVNATADPEAPPLCIAAQNGDISMVSALLDAKGVNLDAVEKNGTTPLHRAAENGHLQVVEALLAKNANVNAARAGSATPLYLAAYKGHMEVVKILLKNGANIDLNSGSAETPWRVATRTGYGEIAHLLKKTPGLRAVDDYLQSVSLRADDDHTTHFTLFGYKFNFGYSAGQKKAAATALKAALQREGEFNRDSIDNLRMHRGALENGKLGAIFRSI